MGTKRTNPPQQEDYIDWLLKDPSSHMQLRGVREISRSRDLNHFRSLIRVFSEADSDSRSHPDRRKIMREIYKIFVELGTFAFIELIDSLASTDEKIRSAAAQIVGYLGICQAIPALFHLLDDESPEVRKYAVRALGRTRCTSDTIETSIIRALNDADPAVVQEAIVAAGRLELKGAVPHLSAIVERILQTQELSDIEHDQIFFATRALGFIGDRPATPVLLKVLKELVDDDHHVPNLLTFGILDSLGDLRDSDSTKLLINALWNYQERCDSAADEEYDNIHDEYTALAEAVERLTRALYHLDRKADGVIIAEFINWIKDNCDGRLPERNRFDLPRPPTNSTRLLRYIRLPS